ncbi:MAG TPA: flagellar filament capping protein FliD [Terriglobales bacterium]|jgi:flagellar hook-associated protein 2
MISLNAATLLSGNGIDVNSLVSQVLAPENGQLQLYQQQQSDLQTQASLLNRMNSDLSSLADAVNSLTDVIGPLTAQTVNSSQPSIVTGSAQSTATPGTHEIVVNTLATQGTLYTDALADANTSILPDESTSGDLEIQIGGPTGATHDVTITAGSNDTLATLAGYINTQAWGVTATVLNDASGARLAIYSQSTGSSGALSVAGNTTVLTFNGPVGGTNAGFTVDGIPFSSDTNTVTGAIPGVTLNLLAAFPGIDAQLSVGPDLTQATQAISNFVSAYNNVISDINQQFTVNPGTNSEGPLASIGSIRSLQSSLLADATYATVTGGFASLRSLGITMNDDGTLSIDSGQLSSVLSNDPSSVVDFFQNAASTGFANNFAADLRNLTDPALGLLNLDLAQNQQEQLNLTNNISQFQDHMTAQQQQLVAEFSQVNALIEAYPFMLEAIDMQLGIQPSSAGSTVPATGTSS